MNASEQRIGLHVKILLGLAAGLAGGALGGTFWPDSRALSWVAEYVADPVGQVFLRFLLMIVIPLIFASLVIGIARLGELNRLGRVGANALAFFAATTLFAAGAGLLLANLFEPGNGISEQERSTLMSAFAPQASESITRAADGLSIHTFVNMVPRNPVAAAADGNLIAFIFFTIAFGIALGRAPPAASKPVVRVLTGVAAAVTGIIGFAMRLAPLGVAGLTFSISFQLGVAFLAPLGLYFALVLAALAVYQFGVLGLVAKVLGGIRPGAFFKAARLPMITAFSTASSSATLPTTLRSAKRGLGIRDELAGFVLPLGATLHMNGTAIFGCITVLFLAQVFGVELSLGTQLMVLLFMALSAVSAAGIPSGSIPLIIVVLDSVGIPGEAIALIFAVEPILGMARTSTNVTGDLAAAVVINSREAALEAKA